MKKAQQIASLWGPVIIWCVLIFYLSSIPQLKAARDPFWDEIIRSILHLLIYAFLFILLFRAINAEKKEKDYFWPVALSILYALSDELHQALVPTRTFEFKDLIIDVTGILFGGLVIWKLLPKAPEKLKHWAKDLQLI